MKAVYKRELASYFKTMIGYIFVFLLLMVVGIYFLSYNLLGGYPILNYTFSNVTFIFLIAIPILTMRSLSEERKQKTDQLLLTSPVSVEKIVIGKYLALTTVFLVPIAIVCLFPLILRTFGEIPFAQNYTAVLGLFLYGAAGISIGLFISSLTENQIIAAVLTFAVLFVCNIMKGLESFLPSSMSGGIVYQIMDAFYMDSRFVKFITGSFDVTAVVYFISVIVIFVFLTIQTLKKRRWK